MRVIHSVLLMLVGVLLGGFIVTRHDTGDDAYLTFAEELPVTSTVVQYNVTDVAGTLIAPEWLLSAAHVAETITSGQMLLTNRGDSVEVAEVVLHPGWMEDGRPEDIALIRLATPIVDVDPVELYTGRGERGREVVVVGNGDFGTGRTGPVGNDGRMRAGTNRVDDATENYIVWQFDDPRKHPEKTTKLEAISGPGDSGGPAFIQVDGTYQVAGVSSGQSTAATNGQEGRYGVTEYYTRVSTYQEWIWSVIAGGG